MKIKVNGNEYTISTGYDRNDDLYFAVLVCVDDNRDVLFERYGITQGEAIHELKVAISDAGLKEGVDNVYVRWEELDPTTQHKIKVYGKKVKSELMGEWLTEEERMSRWCQRMKYYCSEVYPHEFTQADYKNA